MLTKLTIRNFKRFQEVEVELGKSVVFIGPNNSGKTTALQALALWEVGVRKWFERRMGAKTPEKRPGVTINRRDMLAVPVPSANLLWHDLHVRSVRRTTGKQETENIRIDVIVDGISEGKAWTCGLEFDYANEESFYCRPLRRSEGEDARMEVPLAARDVRIAFLPPMSGLAAVETKLDPGAINVRIGQGLTAEVLRNLCYQILNPPGKSETEEAQQASHRKWQQLVDHIQTLFGVKLREPKYVAERGEIVMDYVERQDVRLDLSSSGRGVQQTMLLLAYMYANPGAVLLLDEPDAHLEILRQRQIYQLLTDVATEQGNQVIAATHSEVVLNEAAGRDLVIAFVGRPHTLLDRGSQLRKSLESIGFDQYYQAETRRWVLYLEGATDLAILRTFANTLSHEVVELLDRPFVHYVSNQPSKAREHFFGLQEAVPQLKGVGIWDRNVTVQQRDALIELNWTREEIENYLFYPEVLNRFARGEEPGDLFGHAEANQRQQLMERLINDLIPPVALRDHNDQWWSITKASEVLDRLFAAYFKGLDLPNLMTKTNYHQLAKLVPKELIAREVIEKLDTIVEIVKKAEPQPGITEE